MPIRRSPAFGGKVKKKGRPVVFGGKKRTPRGGRLPAEDRKTAREGFSKKSKRNPFERKENGKRVQFTGRRVKNKGQNRGFEGKGGIF
jgi:hypothetical protein